MLGILTTKAELHTKQTKDPQEADGAFTLTILFTFRLRNAMPVDLDITTKKMFRLRLK